MKAVIWRLAPGVPLFDLTHGIPPQDLMTAAVALEDAWPYLPMDAVICAVVDPGVGTARRAIAVEVGGRFLVGPDNGLFGPFPAQLGATAELDPNRLLPGLRLSATFHGRDLFAPASAILARGGGLAEIGHDAPRPWQPSPIPTSETDDEGAVVLTVVSRDRFGNCAFNLRRSDLPEEPSGPRAAEVRLDLPEAPVRGLAETFADAAPGDPVLYFNSAGRLELAVRNGSAAERFGLAVGDRARLFLGNP